MIPLLLWFCALSMLASVAGSQQWVAAWERERRQTSAVVRALVICCRERLRVTEANMIGFVYPVFEIQRKNEGNEHFVAVALR